MEKSTSYLSTLTEQERQALLLCGIVSDAQLGKANADRLADELAKAADLFPGKVETVPQARLREICAAAQALSSPAPEAAPSPDIPGLSRPRHADDTADGEFMHRECPKLEIRRGGHTSHHHAPNGEHDRQYIATKGSTIHCVRPFRVFFGALATILLAVDMVACVAVPLYLLTGLETSANLNLLAYIALAAALPYFIIARRARCPVCNLRLFSFFHRFSRNRKAHHLLFLGYSVTTALHIIFRFWFCCPACGTAQRLLHRKHARRRRH